MLIWGSCPGWKTILIITITGVIYPPVIHQKLSVRLLTLHCWHPGLFLSLIIFCHCSPPWGTSFPAQIWSKTFLPLIAVVLLSISYPLSAHPGTSYFSYSFSAPHPYLWDSMIPPWFFFFSLSFCLFFTVFSWAIHLFPWHDNYRQPGILSPTLANSRCLENNIRNRVRI